MLFDKSRPLQDRPINRPMGNAQARNTPLGNAPAYGNTTNPNGAQTAASSASRPMVGLSPQPMASASPMGPVQPPSQPAAPAATYPGGDVAGLASYYRNTAMQQYGGKTPGESAMAGLQAKYPFMTNPFLAPQQLGMNPAASAPNPIAPAAAQATANANFMAANPGVGTSSLDASQRAGAMTANNAFQSGMVNRYVGTLPTPQPFDEAASRARNEQLMAGNVDPTNTRGRMAGFGAQPWYEREANAAYQQRVTDAANSPATSAQARENFQARLNADPALKARVQQGQIRRQEEQASFMRQNGMSATNLRRLEEKQARVDRRVAEGKITKKQAEAEMAGFKRTYRAKDPADLDVTKATRDRVRLPDGQLPAETRSAAAETVANMTDPQYRAPSPEFRKQSEIVQSLGLTADMTAEQAMKAILQSPIPQDKDARREYARAIRKYWGAMRDQDVEWSLRVSDSTAPNVFSFNRFAELPEDELDKWIETDLAQMQGAAFPR